MQTSEVSKKTDEILSEKTQYLKTRKHLFGNEVQYKKDCSLEGYHCPTINTAHNFYNIRKVLQLLKL